MTPQRIPPRPSGIRHSRLSPTTRKIAAPGCTSCWIAAETRPCAPWETARLVDREIHESFFPPPITVPVRGDAILSSGYAALNDALGCMGYPQGCVVEWIARCRCRPAALGRTVPRPDRRGTLPGAHRFRRKLRRPLGPGAKDRPLPRAGNPPQAAHRFWPSSAKAHWPWNRWARWCWTPPF